MAYTMMVLLGLYNSRSRREWKDLNDANQEYKSKYMMGYIRSIGFKYKMVFFVLIDSSRQYGRASQQKDRDGKQMRLIIFP